MGSSGHLHYISLKELSFEDIRERMLIGLSDVYNERYEDFYQDLFFEVMEMKSFNDFCHIFGVKVLDYDNDSDIDYSGEYFPQVYDELVLYETDLCMRYQNLPTYCLDEFIYKSEEIWT